MVGLRAVLAHVGDAQHEAVLNFNGPAGSGFGALGNMRGPGLAGFRLNVGESGARRRVRNPDEMVAGRTLDLTTGMAGFTLQRLIAVGAVEFKFGGVHSLHSHHAQTGCKKYAKELFILLAGRIRM